MSNFLNVAVLLETRQEPAELKASLRSIEQDLGRVRKDDKYAPRIIDLDLSLFGSLVLDQPELVLPDPEIPAHAHLAVPLAQLDPTFIHPLRGEELQEIARQFGPLTHLIERSELTSTLRKLAIDP